MATIWLTKKELASISGYSYRRLHDIDAGLPANGKLFVAGENGKYDLALFVQRWVRYNIDAETAEAAKNAACQLDGALSRAISRIYNALMDMAARFYAVVDYPDEDIDPFTARQLGDSLTAQRTALAQLMASYDRGRLVKNGIPCAIVGRPNAGKSSLLNSIIEQKISIVSPKPQTTRNKILGIFTEGDVQMIFVDTPGSLRVSNKLGDFMARSIVSAVRDVNCILVVIDGHNGIKDDDIELLRKHISGGIPTVAVISKTDISQPEKLMPELAKLNSVEGLESVWAVSAKRNRNVRELREYLKRFMTDDVFYFDEDDVTDRSQRFIVCEIIREKILLALDEEVPHGTGVQLNKMEYDPRRRLWDVDANIIVEKASHKPIIIGKRGQTLKEIGTHARQGIEKLLGCRVYLSLWIKVKEDWRNSDYLLKDIGYDKKEELEE